MDQQRHYNFQIFLSELLRKTGYKIPDLNKSGIYRGRMNYILMKMESALHFEFGCLLAMLDRRMFLQQLLQYFYTDKNLKPYLKKYRYSEIKLWHYFKKGNDKTLWDRYNLAGNGDFSLDISINYNKKIFFNVEIKHNEKLNYKVLSQMYRKCAFLTSLYQTNEYQHNEYLFIAWDDKDNQRIFERYQNEEYFVLTEAFKEKCVKGMISKIKDDSPECINNIKRFVANNGIKLITWESIITFLEDKILTQNGIDDSIRQSCSDFLINLKYKYRGR